MKEVPPGEPPRRPNPNIALDGSPDVSVKTSGQEPGMVWVVGPIIAALMVSVCLVLLFVIKKQVSNLKYGFYYINCILP